MFSASVLVVFICQPHNYHQTCLSLTSPCRCLDTECFKKNYYLIIIVIIIIVIVYMANFHHMDRG